MLKQLLSDNRIFGAMVCVLVFIAGGLIYLQTVKRQATQDIQRTQEIVEQRQTPKIEGQPAPGGHYHPDGTYHVGPHEAETPSVSTTPAMSERLDGSGSADPQPLSGAQGSEKHTAPAAKPKPLTPAEEAELKALDEQWKADERTAAAILAKRKAAFEKAQAYFTEAEVLRNKPGRTHADEVRIVELGQLMKEQIAIHDQMYEETIALTESQVERRRRSLELVNRKTQAGTTTSEGRK